MTRVPTVPRRRAGIGHDLVTGPPPMGLVRRWAATVTVCLGLFLTGIDATVLNIAIPDLQRDLRPSAAEVQWIIDGFALVMAGTVLAAGTLGDRQGRRRIFIAGLAVCTLASPDPRW
jgi:MFS family permease